MVPRHVWVLNLDAEEELAARGAYRPSARVEAAVRARRDGARGLLAPGDLTVEELEDEPEALGRAELRGRAWCPTPRALARLAAAGVPLADDEPAPAVDVLRRVVSRGFAAALGRLLPGATWTEDEEDAAAAVLRARAGRPLVAKRAFGAAGRGRRALSGGALSAEDRAWLRASLARGGLLIEPRVEVVREHARHGWIAMDGALRLGVPCVQVCAPSGAWLESRVARADELDEAERAALEEAAREAGAALAAAGYRGPFGVDAFRWRDEAGALRFHAQSELNARYTMGWSIGMRGGGGRGGGTRTRDS